jgi:two-component system, NtrC family, sensor kinase
MILSEATKSVLTRFFIASSIALIVAIYYFSERRSFEYQGYDKNVNLLQRYNAELNEAVVKTRFSILENYDPVDNALNGLHSVIDSFDAELASAPNEKIKLKLDALKTSVKLKEDLTFNFKLINPILINAINQFSTILAKLIESQTSSGAAESALSQDINFQITQDVRNEILQKMNDLLRRTLIYVNMPDEKTNKTLLGMVSDLKSLSQDIQTNITKYPALDFDFNKLALSLDYASKILDLQPQISQIDENLFEVPVISNLNSLNEAFAYMAQSHIKKSSTYRIILYVLVLFLLIVLWWAFSQLRGIVRVLNIEIKRKHKIEKELEEINRQLEHRVAERTREISVKNIDLNRALAELKDTQDQLIIQEKMASVGMLITGIAHEIKNPLNFVNNFADISVEMLGELNEELESSKDKIESKNLTSIEEIISELKTNCIKIKQHGERADTIVKTMLMHSQEAGVQKEKVDLRSLMNNNIHIALESFMSNNQKFEPTINKHYDPDLKSILAAPQSMSRVFIYLLDNAFYAMLEKQKLGQPGYLPVLDVFISQTDLNLIIRIRDNGTGISKKTIDRVFEPFYTTKPTGKGNTGLGLSICYDTIVKQHKGELRVQSEEGEFTEFSINLPLDPKTAHGTN